MNRGSAANDGTGDTIRASFGKVNDNFEELYGAYRTPLQVIATRGQLPINLQTSGANNWTRHESQVGMTVGPVDAVDLRLLYCNFYVGSGSEVAGSYDYTLESAILRPPFGTAIAMTVGPTKKPTVSAGAGIFETNPLGMDVIAGETVQVRTAHVVNSGESVVGGMKVKASNDKMYSSNSTSSQVYTNDTMTAPTGGAISTYGVQPVGLVGRPRTPTVAIAIWGDSIGYGQGDSNDGDGNSGYVERGLWDVYDMGDDGMAPVPYINMSRSGDRVSQQGRTVGVLKRSVIRYATHVLVELGTNDVSNGDSLATIKANFLALYESIRRAGKYVHQAKITPKTVDQTNAAIFSTPYQPGGIRDQLNLWFDDLVEDGTLDGVVDPNSVLEDDENPGFWADASYSTDGLHLSAAGATAASAVVRTWAQGLTL